MGNLPDTEQKIALVGPFPPPYGGISVHIKRIIRLLPEDSYDMYNTSKVPHPVYYRFYGKIKYIKALVFLFRKYKLIHVHATDNTLRIVFGFIGFFKRNIYIHLHGMSHLDFLEAKHPGGWLLRKLISNLHILAVNEKIAARVSRYHPLTITVADAYLPPVFKKEIISNIRVRYSTFFRDDRFIISMNGFFSSYMGIDLYGYDMAAELLSILKKKSIHAYLVACVNGIVNRKIYENFLEKIERNKLSDQVLLIFEAEEAWPFFLLSDVFIRPTCSDGLGVSILEARWAGTPAIASDCIPRPEGTLIFKNRDTDGLAQKVIQVYQEGRKPVENKIRNFRQKPFQSKLIDDIYKISHE